MAGLWMSFRNCSPTLVSVSASIHKSAAFEEMEWPGTGRGRCREGGAG